MSDLKAKAEVVLLHPRPEHFPEIQELCRRVYPFSKPWSLEQLESHRYHFPDGQWVAIDKSTGKVVGLAFSVIISWDDYSIQGSWSDFTAGGFLHNHNPKSGKTLYGVEVMVDPEMRGLGIGKKLYEARQKIVERYGLKRIRAGARMRGYSKYHEKMSPQEYVREVVEKRIYDPTLSFQLSKGFQVLDVARNYLFNDPESLGYAAVIEWQNPKTTTDKDREKLKQSVAAFLGGEKYTPEHLPKELRSLVRQSTLVLGQVIQEFEGNKFFKKVENYRETLKKLRSKKNRDQIQDLMNSIKKGKPENRIKLAHAFTLQLELVNVCEAAYRTWRQSRGSLPRGLKKKIPLTYVLTAHPTEARSPESVEILDSVIRLLVESIHGSPADQLPELRTLIRQLWLLPLAKSKRPSVADEAEYIYAFIFRPEIFDFILSDKSGYDLYLRTWVGGDKDGHPGVDAKVMSDCLMGSRANLIAILEEKLGVVYDQLSVIVRAGSDVKSDLKNINTLWQGLDQLMLLEKGDGNRIKMWKMKFQRYLKSASPFVKSHYQIAMIQRMFEIFPALVLPIELREDAA